MAVPVKSLQTDSALIAEADRATSATLGSEPRVSVVMPCLNEVAFIALSLDSIIASDYPDDRLEILVVDGMSGDGTRAVVADYVRRYPSIRLLDNPKGTTPAALNIGVAHATGDVVIRMDAHAAYPPSYISSLIGWLERSGADNVGACCVTLPSGSSVTAQAIALALSHPLGVGNSHFRIGAAAPRWVDTVPFGCYRREVFQRIGLFDEDLVRNQDEEFNQRLIRAGGRILLVPNVVCSYYARDTISALWRMLYQYGYWKPLVARKVGAIGTARQLVPGTFVLVVTLMAALAPWSETSMVIGLGVMVVYLAVVLAVTQSIGRRHGLPIGLATAVIFPTMHFAYGVGFLRGILDFMLLQRNPERASRAMQSRA